MKDKIYELSFKTKILTFFMAVFSIFAITLNLAYVVRDETGILGNIFHSVPPFNIWNVICVFLLYQVYKDTIKKCREDKKMCNAYSMFPACLFAIFMVFGFSYEYSNSWDLIFGSQLQMLKSFVVFWGYFLVFLCIVIQIYFYLDHNRIISDEILGAGKWYGGYFKKLREHPFFTTVFTLLIAYIPYMIASYPVIFMGDTVDQIGQGYNLPARWSNMLPLISEDVLLNNCHPVAHTLLLHFFMKVGELLHSYNIGLFLYGFFQMLIMLMMIGLMICLLNKLRVSQILQVGLMIYYVITPKINNYMFLISKDVYYVSFLILYFISLFYIINNKKSIYVWSGFYISLIGILLFRNEGIYILILSGLGVLILKKGARKMAMVSILFAVTFYLVYSQCVLPGLKITPGSRGEMLSIPFQQTARYIRDEEDEVTKEEKEAISKVLPYDKIAEKYDPNLSDNVKNMFYTNCSKEDLSQYFKTWFSMFKKHPDIYLEATLNNKYGYFYPSRNIAASYSYALSVNCMEMTNNQWPNDLKLDIHHLQKFNNFRNVYEQLREGIFSVPPMSLLQSAAFYTWIVILCFSYCIRKKQYDDIIYLIPLVVQVLVCIAGPSNGWYFRYYYPIAVCLPMIIIFILSGGKGNTVFKKTRRK